MNINQLKCFISLAERLNFTETAKYLYLSQPNLSLQIAEIEKQLNVKLFLRNSHSVSLTPAGRVFWEEAKNIVKKSEEAIEKTRQTACGLAGNLKLIFFLNSVSRCLLPNLINKFQQTHPHISISLYQVKAEDFCKALNCTEADLGIIPEIGIEKELGIDKQFLYNERVCVAVPCNHPLAAKTSVSLSELADEQFVVLSREAAPFYSELMQRLCSKGGFAPIVVREVLQTDIQFLLVEVGVGIALVPQIFSVKYQSPYVRYIDIEEEDAGGDVVIVWKKGMENPLISLFLNEASSFDLSQL